MATSNYGMQPAPAQYPPPQRSFAGPIVLILIGVFFLLGNLQVLAWRDLGHYFARYWPALLIVWGIIKLIEYTIASHSNRRAARIGVGGVFLIIFLVIAGLIASSVERVNWNAISSEMDLDNGDFFGEMFGGQEFTTTQNLEQDFPAGAMLRVSSDRGGVTVTTWDQKRIKVVVEKKLRAQNQEDANKADAATQAQLTTAGNEITLNANTHGGGNRPVESNLQIYLPANASLDIGTRRGDVVVRNITGNVQVSDSRGDITLEEVKGNANLTLRRGDVKASKITGDVVVDGTVSEVNIADVGGKVRLNGGVVDSMTLARIAKGVNYQSSRTTMELAKLDGEMTLQQGDLNGSQVVGPLRITTRSKDIHLEDVSGEVTIENSNGVIEVHVSKVPVGPMTITNRRADIRLTLPTKAAFQVEARTRRGDINTDFGLSVQSHNGQSAAAGTVGSGGPKLEINNDAGDVEIRKTGNTTGD